MLLRTGTTCPSKVVPPESAKDLIRKMLNPDPRVRITAAEVLQHPWMIEHVNNKLAITKKLNEYCARRKLKRAQYVAYIMTLLMNNSKKK